MFVIINLKTYVNTCVFMSLNLSSTLFTAGRELRLKSPRIAFWILTKFEFEPSSQHPLGVRFIKETILFRCEVVPPVSNFTCQSIANFKRNLLPVDVLIVVVPLHHTIGEFGISEFEKKCLQNESCSFT